MQPEDADFREIDFAALFRSADPDRPDPGRIVVAGEVVLTEQDGLRIGDPGSEGIVLADELPAGRFAVAVALEPLPEPAAGQHSRVHTLAVAFSGRPAVRWEGALCEPPSTSIGLLCLGSHDGPAVAPLVHHARRIIEARDLTQWHRDTIDESLLAGYRIDLADHPTTPDPAAYRDGWHAVPDPLRGGDTIGALIESADCTYGLVGHDAEGRPVAYVHFLDQ